MVVLLSCAKITIFLQIPKETFLFLKYFIYLCSRNGKDIIDKWRVAYGWNGHVAG